MTLKEQLQSDLTNAMRQANIKRRDTLRLLMAAIKQVEIDQRIQLDDSGVQSVLKKEAKQRRETIADAEKAGRLDLASEAQTELEIIESYLPTMLSPDEIRSEAVSVIAELGAQGPQDVGRVMSQLMPRLKGKADGRIVSDIVRGLLQR